MTRISDTELARLKRDISLERLVESSGVELERRGRQLFGLCPFHADTEPSLVIDPRKNLWNCLGACAQGGSVIDWVMKSDGLSFVAAVERLRERTGSLAAEAARPSKPATDRSSPPAVDPYIDADTQLQQALAHYHDTLHHNPEALAYLERRGLGSAEMIDHFRLGFVDRSLGARLPDQKCKGGRDIRSKLKAVGLLRESGYEHFAGCITVPLFDAEGRVVEVYGRRVSQQGTKRAKHLYLPGPHRGVFNLPALQASNEVIVCESILDALTFWCAGYRNVTASFGTNGFTDEMQQALHAHGIERILIAYDRDDAGDAAAQLVAQQLIANGFTCFRVLLPKGMDANDYALKVAPADKSLGLAIRKAQWLGGTQSEPSTVTESLATVEPPPAPQEPTPLAASPVPPPPSTELDEDLRDQEIILRTGERRWRIRGLDKNLSYDVMKVNLLCSKSNAFHVDTFDLYSARHRGAFLKEAAAELQLEERVLKKDLGKVLLRLEQLQDEQIRAALQPQDDTPTMSAEEREQAMKLLRSPELLERILEDFDRCGVVGERTNKLTGYIAAVSRKLDRPLAIIIQSSSAAGKSSLMNALLAFIPEEQRVQYSAMTGQSLFYMGETDLKNKILAIVEEEGAERASYALKLLQSEGVITIASTGKEPVSGRMQTQVYRVEGPVMIILTTTAIEIDDELLNRCIVLTVDESRAQTAAIHTLQRASRTLEGIQARAERETLVRLHQNAQRLLEPLAVRNPYATRLTFRDDQTRTRRDHEKYLTLIDAITLLHQHQREVKTLQTSNGERRYVEVTLDDIALANELAHEILGQSLDELPPQTRRLLSLIDAMVSAAGEREGIDRSDYRFTRRDVREYSGWGNTQLKVHLRRLEELEYLVVHQGGPGRRMLYELVYDEQAAREGRFLSGLLDTARLDAKRSPLVDSNRSGSGGNRSGQKGHQSGRGRGEVGPKSGGGRGGANGPQHPLAAPTSPNPFFAGENNTTGWVERRLSLSVVDAGGAE